jgi:hypothetical protein
MKKFQIILKCAVRLANYSRMANWTRQQHSPQAIARIVERKQSGLLLTTEIDNRVEDQRRIAAAYEIGGVPLKFEITPNIGNWYLPDLAEKLGRAIVFILA